MGLIEDMCRDNDVPFFSSRGYNSSSEMWSSSQRCAECSINHDQVPIIFHLGDHDPSGNDMTRDIIDRMKLFVGGVEVKRLALNMDQIDKFNPPPNPAKVTDPRFIAYIAEFGDKSWELDALEPGVIVDVIKRAIESVKDDDAWEEAVEQEDEGRSLLHSVSERWEEVISLLNELNG